MSNSRQRFEYSQTTNNFLTKPDSLVIEMNKMAGEGWRVISMFGDERSAVTIYYEREVEPGTS